MRPRALSRYTLPIVVLLVAAACSGGDAEPATTTSQAAPATTAAAGPATAALTVVDNDFPGGSITVQIGDTVEWVWDADNVAPHSVTSGDSPTPDGIFDSGVDTPPNSFSFTFTEEGTFTYFCVVHPTQMRGTITVTS